MMRRTIAVIAGLVLLAGLAMLPATAGAQTPPSVAPTSAVPPGPPEEQQTPPRPQDTRPVVRGDSEVRGDVVSRPLPRTGNDIGGTAVFGGALTVLGIALALGARKRRNSFEGV